MLSGHPILIEGFTAFLPDKTAFYQMDGRSEGPAHPSKGPSRFMCFACSGTTRHQLRRHLSTM